MSSKSSPKSRKTRNKPFDCEKFVPTIRRGTLVTRYNTKGVWRIYGPDVISPDPLVETFWLEPVDLEAKKYAMRYAEVGDCDMVRSIKQHTYPIERLIP